MQCQAKDIVAWFFCEGAYDLRISHAIPQNVRIALAAPRSKSVSPVFEWAARRMPVPGLSDVAKEHTPRGVLEWLDAHDHEPTAAPWRDLLRESQIVAKRARFDDPPKPVSAAACGRLREVVPDMASLLLIDGEPEYMCTGGAGERLLLREEWYPVEPAFVWSRAPISTILFCIDESTVEWLRIGLIFDRTPMGERMMKVIVNNNTLWTGTINDASSGELILACTGRCLAPNAPNLLQIEVEKAFVPAEYLVSSDRRRLGIGLKRLWIQRGEGFPLR
jgi:hypothetical protein